MTMLRRVGFFSRSSLLGGLCFAVAIASPARSDVFTSTASGSWDQNTNWSPIGIPGVGDTAILNNGGSLMSLAGDTTVANFHLGDSIVGGRINLNGSVLTGTTSITIGRFGGAGSMEGRSAMGSAKFITPSLTVNAAVNSNFPFYDNDRATSLSITSGAKVITAVTENVSSGVSLIGVGSTLELGANLLLSQDLIIQGVADGKAIVDAQNNNITARDIFIGHFGGAGDILNDGAITATRHLGVSRGSFTLDANDSVTSEVQASNGGVLTLHTATAATAARLSSGGRINTVATGNLTNFASVIGADSLLDLGANLTLSEDLTIQGSSTVAATVNANGHQITARDIHIGSFGGLGNITNDGAIIATRHLEVSGGTFTLDANDSVANEVQASNSGVLSLDTATTAVGARISSGGRINTVATGNLTTFANINGPGSILDLGANLSLTQDLLLQGSSTVAATVNANGNNISARDIHIGAFGGLGTITNDGAIAATRNLNVSRGTFALDENDTVANQVGADNGGVLDLHASTATLRAVTSTGGRINTVATSNLSVSASALDQNSLLNLGANLVLSEDLVIQGTAANTATVDANGYDITARDIYIGRFNNVGQILDRGKITATRNLLVSRGTFALEAIDVVTNQVGADNGGVLDLHTNTSTLRASIATGGRINTVVTSNLTTYAGVFGQGSLLNLGANLVLSEDLELQGTGANAATVNANGNDITARDLYLGRFGGAGAILNRGKITVTRNLDVSNNTFALNAADSVANQVSTSSGGVLDLHANTVTQRAVATSGGRINTVATSNLTTSAGSFDQGSLLNLGANLVLSQDLEIRGTGTNIATANANGHDISARDIYIGRFNNSGSLLNEGALTANRLFVERSTATLTGENDVFQTEIDLRTGAVLNINQALDELQGVTLNGNTLDILDTSVMNLNFDANTAAGVLDFAFRWANPTVGDRIAQLTSLIGSGRIVVSSPISVSVFGIGDGYTYIGVNPNPNYLVGDYNEDGVVNAADYVTWRDHLNAPEGTLPNDISVGSIGESQYLVWKSRFGNELSEGSVESTAVPEPSFAVLLLLVSPALKCFTRRHPLNLRRVEGSY